MTEFRKDVSKVNYLWICQICEGEDFKLVCEKSSFKYVECASCGVVRQYPYPTDEEIERYYHTYKSIKQKDSPYLSDSYYETYCMEKKLTFSDLRFPLDEFKDKRVLDVGCAIGQFVQYLQEQEAQVQGIDVSAELVEIACKKGLQCSTTPLFEVQQKFDCITMWHMIEHVVEPRAYLEHVYIILNSGGSFFVETPCTGIISEAFGEEWRFYMPVEHIHLFSQKSLFKLLSDIGFHMVSWVRFGSGNTTGTIPPLNKKVFDTIAKGLGIGDVIAVWCMKD